MKTNITKMTSLMAASAMAFTAMAQVTIDRADYPRQATFTDSFTTALPATPPMPLPAEGPNQVWDYSLGYLVDHQDTLAYTDATSDPDFPLALNVCECDLQFQGFFVPGSKYEAIDSSGFYEYGVKYGTASYSIANLTGGATDSIHFLAHNDIFQGRLDLLKFPLNYNDSWTESQVETVKFSLDIAGFGLARTPSERRTIETRTREVVGHGTLRIPMSNGLPSPPMDVLLLKSTRTRIDTFTLGGALAPPSLLFAFGVSQGETSIDETYLFFRPGFSAPVASMAIVGGAGEDLEYRPQAVIGAPVATGPFSVVSHGGWDLSTTVTTATANRYPWPGVPTVPAASTFTQPVMVGQPYPWEHLNSVDGTQVISSLSGVTYYSQDFSLDTAAGLEARFRMFVDDNMEIFINGHSVAREEGMGPVYWRTVNHDLLFDGNGGVINGNAGGDPFDAVTSADMDTIFKVGMNTVVLAIRNRTSKPDKGGFSFRMDLEKGGITIPIVQEVAAKSSRTISIENTGVSVYPNPTRNLVNVSRGNFNIDAQLVLQDLSGKILETQTVGESAQLDLSGRQPGVYLLKVVSGDEISITKILKQ